MHTTFHTAVSKNAEMNNLSMETAAYRVIEDIHYYNKLGGIKKELSDVNTKVFVMNQISARQNNAVMTVTKLQSREVTEDQILYLSKYLGEKNTATATTMPEIIEPSPNRDRAIADLQIICAAKIRLHRLKNIII